MPKKLFILFLFITNFAHAQDLDWVKAVSADSTSSVSKIEITPENDVIIFGHAIGKFHGLPDNGYSGSENYYSFLIKYDQGGNQIWSIIPNKDSFYINDFSLDKAGNIYVSGNYPDTLNKAPISFLVKMNSQRQVLWKKNIKNASYLSIINVDEDEILLLSDSKQKSIQYESGIH